MRKCADRDPIDSAFGEGTHGLQIDAARGLDLDLAAGCRGGAAHGSYCRPQRLAGGEVVEQHDGRAAVGICVRCRRPLCGDCITKLDGINHCRACIEALAALPAPAPPGQLGALPARLMLSAGVGAPPLPP